MGDEYYMGLALQEAETALKEGNWPIGAVIVLDNNVISRSHNHSYTEDKLSHAEYIALKKVQDVLNENRRRAILYTTYEPCPMCFGAIMLSRIKRVVCGIDLDNSGAMYLKENAPLLFKQKFDVELVRGVLAKECSEVFLRSWQAKELLKKGLINLKELEELL